MGFECVLPSRKLVVTIDGNDDNYMPYRILVMGGLMEDLKKLNDVSVDQSVPSSSRTVTKQKD